MNLLYDAIVQRRSALDAPPGDLLYISTFDAFEDEWQQYSGRLSAQILDSAMRISVDNVQSAPYSLTQPYFNAFDATLTARASAGPEDNGFGMVFGLQDNPDDCDMPLRLLCDLAQIDLLSVPLRLLFRPAGSAPTSYYMFLVSSDGYYSLWRSSGDNARRISTWISSDLIYQGIGATNQLRVVVRGDRFQFFINEQNVDLCLANDPANESTYFGGECVDGTMQNVLIEPDYLGGRLGVVARSDRESGVVVDFETLIITSPLSINDQASQQT